jgi:hypothetical protein
MPVQEALSRQDAAAAPSSAAQPVLVQPLLWLPRWAVSFAALLALLGVFGLTGSSGALASREDLLLTRNESRSLREIFSTSRWIRSDEFAIEQAAHRAQQLAKPSYPVVNLNFGLGQLQRNPFAAPVLDWGLAFSPLSWPLLFPSRWALGLRWFLRAAIIVLGLVAWLSVLAWRKDAGDGARRANVAALGGIAIFFSSTGQWLANHGLFDLIACSGLAAFAFHNAFRARSRTAEWLWLLGGAWWSTCGFFHFYAPGWAPALWLIVGATADVALKSAGSVRRAVLRAVLPLALVAAGVVVAILYYAPFVQLVRDSLYPGRRIAFAGEVPWTRLLDLIWPSLHESAPLHGAAGYFGKHPLLNVCEMSAVEALPLFFAVVLALTNARVRGALRRVGSCAPGTTVAWTILGAYCFLPLPSWFRDATLLRWSPGSRTFWFFGALSAALGTIAICELGEDSGPADERARRTLLDGGVAACFIALAFILGRRELAGGDRSAWGPIGLTAALLLTSAFALRSRWGPWLLLGAWLVPLLIATAPVNPLARSKDLFFEGAGHAAVDRALRNEPGRLVDFGTHWAATLDGFGWPVLDSVDFAPDLDLFRFLAPDSPGLNETVYNRYGIAQFTLPPAPLSSGLDAFRAQISPCSPRLAALGVNHFLARAEDRLPAACAEEFASEPAGQIVLWSRRRPVGGVGAAHAAASSALDFDWSASGAGRLMTIKPGREGLGVELPAAEGMSFALPINLSIVDEVTCRGASARSLDTHLVFLAGTIPARCEVHYLGTSGALRRMLNPGAPRIVFRSEVVH